jgi:hypothetical protein
MARVICLANSRKHGNACIAGIDVETGAFVRPVSKLPDGGITWEMREIGGAEPQLLDILDIPTEDTGPDYGFQRENRWLGPGKWKKIGRATVDEVLGHCEQYRGLLYNDRDRVSFNELRVLPRIGKKSLQLIRCNDASYYEKVSPRGTKKFRIRFTYGGVRRTEYDLAVTDPQVEALVLRGESVSPSCIILVSLGMPFPECDPTAHCFKLAAGIIELNCDAC